MVVAGRPVRETGGMQQARRTAGAGRQWRPRRNPGQSGLHGAQVRASSGRRGVHGGAAQPGVVY
jgi:hypothetical protein